jgi:hypothetical protein
MFCICLQVNKQQDLLVLLKFGLLSEGNILAIKQINRLLQEGAMNQSSVYKQQMVDVPKAITANDSAKADTASYTSSPLATNKRASSPAQTKAVRVVKAKSASNGTKRKRATGRHPVSAGGNQIALGSTS